MCSILTAPEPKTSYSGHFLTVAFPIIFNDEIEPRPVPQYLRPCDPTTGLALRCVLTSGHVLKSTSRGFPVTPRISTSGN